MARERWLRSLGGRAARVPAWVYKLLGIAGAAVALFWLLGRSRRAEQEESDSRELAASLPRRQVGQRFIVLAGRGRAGKSSVANALLGTSLFGPEAPPNETAQYRDRWWLRELPAAALSLADPKQLSEHLTDHDILVLVVDEQLYHLEKRFLRLLTEHFPKVRRLVFINKADLLEGQYTPEELEQLQSAVRQSVTSYLLDPADCVWGAAAGAAGAALGALEERLESLLD